MAVPTWQVSRQYYETCNCDFVCPCLPGGLAVRPSKGTCAFAMAFEVSHGAYGTVGLDDLGFIVLGFTPGAMAKGDWSVGLIVDERASAEQREAITANRKRCRGWSNGRAVGTRRKVSGRAAGTNPLRSCGCEVVGQGLGFRGHGCGGREGHQPGCLRADEPRQHGPSGRRSLRAGARPEEPCRGVRFGVGRRQWHEQWTVRALFLAQRV